VKKLLATVFVPLLAVSLAGCAEPASKEGVGAVTGAVIGGVIGHQIGGGRGKDLATVVGVVAGAAIGASIGRGMDEQDRLRAARVLEYNQVGQTTTWHNPDTNVYYSMAPTNTYQGTAGQPCREYTTEITIDGRRETARGTACRNADGTWKVLN